MLDIKDHDATLVHVNQRIQRHGDERKLAVDIKFNLRAANTTLDSIEKGLRESLFRKPSKGEQQDLPQIGDNQLSAVKHACLEPQKLKHTFEGYDVEIAGLLEATDSIPLVGVTLKRFVITPLEGGSVEMTFSASTTIDPDELAALSEALIREDVRLTLTPPAKQELLAAA